MVDIDVFITSGGRRRQNKERSTGKNYILWLVKSLNNNL